MVDNLKSFFDCNFIEKPLLNIFSEFYSLSPKCPPYLAVCYSKSFSLSLKRRMLKPPVLIPWTYAFSVL